MTPDDHVLRLHRLYRRESRASRCHLSFRSAGWQSGDEHASAPGPPPQTVLALAEMSDGSVRSGAREHPGDARRLRRRRSLGRLKECVWQNHACVSPAQPGAGEVIEIKTLLSHPMETGHRRDVYGKLIPRQIIHTFTCTYNGAEVFRADWYPAVAANPYLTFYGRYRVWPPARLSGSTTRAPCMPLRPRLPWRSAPYSLPEGRVG